LAGRPIEFFPLFQVARIQMNTHDRSHFEENTVNNPANRRDFLKRAALAGAAFTLPAPIAFSSPKSLLVFTKSSGFEHQVVKRTEGKLSICEIAVSELGKKHGFHVEPSKDGRIFDSPEFHSFQSVLFFTTGDLTQSGTDKNPPMSPAGKQTLLDTIQRGMGFAGVHAASDTFHTQPDSADLATRYPTLPGLSAQNTVASEFRLLWDTRDLPITPSRGSSGELFIEKTSLASGSDSDFVWRRRTVDRSNEPIATPSKRLDIYGSVRRFAQRIA